MGHGDGGGRPPYGWTATGGGSAAFVPVADQIAVLARIRKLSRVGLSAASIAEIINDTGARTKTGLLWDRKTIANAIRAIERFGIPADIDAATESAHQLVAQMRAGGYRLRNYRGRPSSEASRGQSVGSDSVV